MSVLRGGITSNGVASRSIDTKGFATFVADESSGDLTNDKPWEKMINVPMVRHIAGLSPPFHTI